MAKYVVASASLFENEMKMEQVEANSAVEAIQKSTFAAGMDYAFEGNPNLDTVIQRFFDGDNIIGAILVTG